MTQTHEFNENLALTNKGTFDALVSHYNKIEDIAKNKKFEWEDEGIIPEQQIAITYDFNEWLDTCEKLVKEESEYKHFPEKTVYSREEIVEDAKRIIDYINGFILMPVGIYNHKAIMTHSKQFDTHDFEQVVEYFKNLKSENQKVFLYGLYKRAEILKKITFEREDGIIVTYPPKPANYLIRFAVYND